MKEYIPKVTLLVRQGLENVENLPFIIQGLEYVDNGEYIPVQYRKAFYKFLNDFFKVTMSDSTIFRLIRTRVSALPGKHQKEELKMKDLIERRLGYKNLSKSLAHRKGVRGLGKFSSKLGNKKRNTMTEETVTEKKHSKHIGFDGLVKKLMAQGKSRKYAEAIAGKVNAEKHGTWHEETNLEDFDYEEMYSRRKDRIAPGYIKMLRRFGHHKHADAAEARNKELGRRKRGTRIKGKHEDSPSLEDQGKRLGSYSEETNLQELSNNTLANYWRKATAHVGRFKYTSRGEFMDQKKVNKRAKGRLMAASKLHSREQSHKLSSNNEETNLGESRIDPVTAHEILTKHNAHGDFYTLNHDSVSGLIASAKEHGYRKSKNAPGSTARMFHSHLTRLAARRDKNLGEETDLQEVSGDKAVSYISRAAGDAKMNRLKSISHGKAGQNDQAKLYWKKAQKRLKGIKTAKEKLGIQAEEINLQENIDLKSASVASLESIIKLPAKKRLAGSRASAYEIQLAKAARMELLRRRQKGVKEEVEQLETDLQELSKKTLGSYLHKATDTAGYHNYAHAANNARADNARKSTRKHIMDWGKEASSHKKTAEKREKGIHAAVDKLTKEEVEQLETDLYETLLADATSGDWIHDFVHSKNKKFKGKSKRERIRMALGAYYAKQHNESLDVETMELIPITEEQLQELSNDTFKSFVVKSTENGGYASGSEAVKRLLKRQKHALEAKQRIAKIELAKGKLKTEDQLQELYQSTTKSYIKKATKSADRINDKLHKAEDKAMSTDGEKYPERQRKYEKMSQKLEAKWGKRLRGIELAKDKLKEETQMSEYRDRFSAALKKFGITDVSLLDEIAMKDFLTYVDTQNESVISAAGRKSLPMSDELKAQIAADMAKRKEKKNTLLALAKDEYSKIPSSSYRNRPKDAKKLFHKIPKSERAE